VRLVSRKGNVYKLFEQLRESLPHELKVRDAILDGEIVHVGQDGRSDFLSLMRRRRPVHFYAFDLLKLDREDLRDWTSPGDSPNLRGCPQVQPSESKRRSVPLLPFPLARIPVISLAQTFHAASPSMAQAHFARQPSLSQPLIAGAHCQEKPSAPPCLRLRYCFPPGTFRFNSSNQLSTTLICFAAGSCAPGWTIRNRRPSGVMS
jgi:hypothetical protein